MTAPSPKALRRGALAVGFAGLAIASGSLAPALASSAQHSKAVPQPPVVTGSRYLALGDSLPFGYREANSIPAPNFSKPKTFIGYPEQVAKNLGLVLTNAACPGETTASFINNKAQSNGCENNYVKGQPPADSTGASYRANYPLHVAYKGSQLAFAEKYLKQYPNTRLVTLMVGANDGFICQKKYTDGCLSELGALQKQITKNVMKIFKGLRNTAHYNGQIALMTYFSLDYNDQTLDFEIGKLNDALLKAAKPFKVEISDGYGSFNKASAQGHHNPCTAQLLTALSGPDKGTCGVHLSYAGAAVLGQALERVIKK